MAFHSFAAIVVKDAAAPLSARELSAAVRLEQVREHVVMHVYVAVDGGMGRGVAVNASHDPRILNTLPQKLT